MAGRGASARRGDTGIRQLDTAKVGHFLSLDHHKWNCKTERFKVTFVVVCAECRHGTGCKFHKNHTPVIGGKVTNSMHKHFNLEIDIYID